MKSKLFFFPLILFLLIFCLLPLQNIQAAKPLDVVINEIAWMGNINSANDEWIELYNNSDSPINLIGWILKAADGAPKINLTGTIPAKGFYLLERTDDNTVPGIPADQIYTGAIRNQGENLALYENLENSIDTVNCSSDWFAGDNTTKQTMERKNSQIPGNNSENWQSSQSPQGTPKAKNNEQKTTNNEQKTEELKKNTPLPISLETKEYPLGIIFNEIMPAPEGPDAEEEWIEIFNQNNSDIDLSGWKIKDTSGKITTYSFLKETKISLQGFLVLFREKTKITLNNDQDGLILTSPDGKIIDEVNYKKAPKGKSYNRFNSDWLWIANLTPGAPNITEKIGTQSPEDKSTSETKEKIELAAVGEQIIKPSKSLFILLIALGTAISSGIIILILKKKVKNRI